MEQNDRPFDDEAPDTDLPIVAKIAAGEKLPPNHRLTGETHDLDPKTLA